jgi:hypothetical protein
MMTQQIKDFIGRWKGNTAGETKVAQQHFLELCQALGVPVPSPQEAEELTYCFERTIKFPPSRGKQAAPEYVDVYRKDHFVWENKQGTEKGSARLGHGRRGTATWRREMNKAKGQAIRYALHVEHYAPPFVVVCDVGHQIRIWRDFTRSGKAYEHFRVLSYDDLDDEKAQSILRGVLNDPTSLNPAHYQVEVTKTVAESLAKVAKSLEKSEHPPALVARFLMRCVFTMFAEDTGLLPDRSFTDLLGQFINNPNALPAQLEHLWRLMDRGGFVFGIGNVLRFNGGLFKEQTSLPLTKEQIKYLYDAAEHDWSEVEPTIFGTLVEQALDDVERHALGAHFTPRPYIERLVRPTVIEPLRDEWMGVEAVVTEMLL